MNQPTDIAIIGMSGVFPGAVNIGAFWNNILNKVDAIEQAPAHRLDAVYFDSEEQAVDRFYCRRGGFIDEYAEFDPLSFGILPVAVEGTEPEHLLTLALAKQALADAGVWQRNTSLEHTGIIIGKGNYTGPGATRAIEIVRTGEQLTHLLKSVLPHLQPEELDRVKKEFQVKKGRFGADTAMGLIPNLVASLVANRLNLGGTAYTIDAACASSLIAIDHAVNELTSGRLNMVIAGGVHVSQNAPFWSIFTQLGALSKKEQIRPFDNRADGLLIGEGCGFIILKRLEEALRDEDRIYAVIKGVGVASDGAATSVMSPSVKGQSRAIIQAWEKAGIPRTEIGYIEAHGTGTPLGDKTELETLQQVFGEAGNLPHAGIGSVKSMIGHAMPAAGIAGVIKTAMALYTGKLPPTLHCEEPLALMNSTRFRPVQETTDWEASGKPRYAGVNAFGFGGINAHVVLQEAPRVPASVTVTNEPLPEMDEVLLLARPTAEQLIKALQDNETTPGEGQYRIAIFNPTADRIGQAMKIVARNKPWRNRQDIWFSNDYLIGKGGKIAFLFPGLDGLGGGEIASVGNYFRLQQHEAATVTETGVLSASLQLLHRSNVLDTALRKLGVQPDLVAGHSLGEWLAGRSVGLADEAGVAALLSGLQPEQFELPDTRFLVVGCSYERIAPMMNQIPDIYLSIDNCPQQVILCGTCAATDTLMELLRTEQVYHQVLAFRSGFHSPFIRERLNSMEAGMNNMQFARTTAPLWSATTLTTYPEDAEGIKALSVRHLTEPVYFRQLIEKLHEQEVRVFIQIGSGGLTGFVDDTLNQKHTPYSAVSANVASRGGLQQLQRVLAALYAEGAAINRSLMGVHEQAAPLRASAMKLQLGSPFVKEFAVLQSTAPSTVPAYQAGNARRPDDTNPLAVTYWENVEQMLAAQQELLEVVQVKKNSPARLAEREKIHQRLHISLATHPYLKDHALLKQKPGWYCAADTDPVIPMTMILELLAEAALEKAPGEVLQAIRNIRALQWMNVANAFTETITGVWKNNNHALLEIEKYAQAEVVTGTACKPAAPAQLNTGKPLPYTVAIADIYEKHMFHGPAYQGIKQIVALGDKGMTAVIEGGAGKGSLLDNAGQLFGLWLQLVLEKDRIAFPVKIEEIQFYESMHDQQGSFTCTCSLTALTDEFATADLVLTRNDKVWALIRGWQNRRLEIDERLWNVSMSPLHHYMATEIAPGIFWFNNAYNRVVSWDFILKRYFNQEEKAHYRQLSVSRKKEWLISRVAVKDAVRTLVHGAGDDPLYPIELEITADEQGKPLLKGPATEGIQISLAHKHTEAVAIARFHGAVGIDIEEIAERSAGFKEMVFNPEELLLLAGKPDAEWCTRSWVAKEAYGKKLGRGLMGNPRAYVIKAINGEDILVNDTWITTIQHQNYIVGWTA